MKTIHYPFDGKIRQAGIGLGIGLLLFSGGALSQWLTAGAFEYGRAVSALGILLAGWGGANLLKYRTLRHDPAAARRIQAEEQDERARSIRQQAGYVTFLWSISLTCVGLLGYSFATRGSDPLFSDPIWNVLALLVVIPGLLYIINLIRFNQKY